MLARQLKHSLNSCAIRPASRGSRQTSVFYFGDYFHFTVLVGARYSHVSGRRKVKKRDFYIQSLCVEIPLRDFAYAWV